MQKIVLVVSLALVVQVFGENPADVFQSHYGVALRKTIAEVEAAEGEYADIVKGTALRIHNERGYEVLAVSTSYPNGYTIFKDPKTGFGYVVDISYDGKLFEYEVAACENFTANTLVRVIKAREARKEQYDAAKALEESEKAWRDSGIRGRIR